MKYKAVPVGEAQVISEVDYFVIDNKGEKTVAYYSSTSRTWVSSCILIGRIEVDHVLMVVE